MGEDLKRANAGFEKFFNEITKNKNWEHMKKYKGLLYLFYLKGFNEGSGITQVIV